jgi:hypothetical protein
MDHGLFAWSVAASLVASVLYALLPQFARALVWLRTNLLPPGPDTDRIREEWSATLWEIGSRGKQFYFALRLFRDYRVLQTEIEFRANEETDIDSLVRQRVLQELDVLRMSLNAELRREQTERIRHEIEMQYQEKRKEQEFEHLTGHKQEELAYERRRAQQEHAYQQTRLRYLRELEDLKREYRELELAYQRGREQLEQEYHAREAKLRSKGIRKEHAGRRD